jgi:hypothetical protein
MTGLPEPNMCHAKTTPKAVHTGEGRNRERTAGKLRLYEILYALNPGFEQVLHQLQELEKLGLGQRWQTLQTIVEENRAEIKFELVERLQERELRDWTHFGRLRPTRRGHLSIRGRLSLGLER